MDARQPTGSRAAHPGPTPTPAQPAPPARRGRRERVITVVKWVAAVVAIGLLVLGIVRQWDAIVEDFARLDVITVSVGLVATVAALVANMLSWRAMMAATGSRVPLAAASSIFFVGQLGKYIPGGVWSIAAQAELGRAHGLARTGSAVASLASMLVSMVTAALVGIVALLVSASDGLVHYWWLVVVVAIGLVALTPPVLSRLITLAFRVLRRPAEAVALTWTGTAASMLWSVVMWLLYGVQATFVLHAFGADGPSVFAVATGAYAVAWLVGFLVVVAPAGLGAREGVLVLLLASVASPSGGAALALAVVSRVLMTIGDVLLAGVGSSLAVRHRRALARSAATPSGPRDRH